MNFDDPFGLCPPQDKNDGPECRPQGPTPSQLRQVVDDLAAQADALEQSIEIAAAVTVAPAAVVLAADAAGPVLAGQAGRTLAQGARQKIADLALRARTAVENSKAGSYAIGFTQGFVRQLPTGGSSLPAFPLLFNPNYQKGLRQGGEVGRWGKTVFKLAKLAAGL